MIHEMKTITIAGGGLAGLALGVGLVRRGVPVVLHEAMKYPRHRVCGEFMAGLHHPSLEDLGVSECLADAAAHTQSAWFDSTGCWGDFSLPEPAYTLSRYTLDERLMQQLRHHGGVVEENSRYAIDEVAEGTVVAAGRPRTPAGRPSAWLGLKMHVCGLSLRQPLEMHFGHSAYLGLAAVEDGWVNVSGLFRGAVPITAKREQLLLAALRAQGLTELAERIEAATWREGSFVAVSDLSWGSRPRSTWAVGDAAQMIPPFTGHGMSLAFRSAALALDPLCGYAAGRMTWASALAHYQRRLRSTVHFRLRCACWLQQALLTRPGRPPLRWLARRRWLPFRTLYRLTHAE
jgi:menaquinone-9 beta-reductase